MFQWEICYKRLWYIVGKDLTFNGNWWKVLCKRWWLNYNHFQIFLHLAKAIFGQNWNKLKLTSQHIRAWLLPLLPFNCWLESGFSDVHSIVAPWHSVKPVVLFSRFEGPSPKRTMLKVFETTPRSSLLTFSLSLEKGCQISRRRL